MTSLIFSMYMLKVLFYTYMFGCNMIIACIDRDLLLFSYRTIRRFPDETKNGPMLFRIRFFPFLCLLVFSSFLICAGSLNWPSCYSCYLLAFKLPFGLTPPHLRLDSTSQMQARMIVELLKRL